MEPLVLFGVGLVVYCGYLALQDEICDIRRSHAKSRAKCGRKAMERGKCTGRTASSSRFEVKDSRIEDRGSRLKIQSLPSVFCFERRTLNLEP
jgi:hypothetical protein